MKFTSFLCRFLFSSFVVGVLSFPLVAQEEDWDYDQMLQRIDTIENPVYKPVVSLSYGILSFTGDVRNKYSNAFIGSPAGRVSISTFIDNQHHIRANFYFMAGILSGEEQSLTALNRNLNFRSNLISIGISSSYAFGHFLPERWLIRPYVGLGVEQINFDTKGDLFDGDGNRYNYWSDGTVRSIPEGEYGAALPLMRNYVFETDLRSFERAEHGLGDYSVRSVGIPVELGLQMKVSERMFIQLGADYHFTFSDYIDNVAKEGTYIVGDKAKDSYLYTHATLHFDMFSDPKTRTVDLLYADYELDPVFFDDEDGDFVLDLADRCPGTPYGVVTDTLGCPLDEDHDGVPDYLDKEPDSPRGIWVDDQGVSVSEEEFLGELNREEALDREDLEAYLEVIEAQFSRKSIKDIPERFVSLDTDEDGYISFDELLHVIDAYFDFQVDLNLEELRQVNEFFFSQ